MIPPMMSAEEFELLIGAVPFNGSLVLDIFKTHNIICTMRMYKTGKLEPAIEDGRVTRNWNLEDIIVIHNLTFPAMVIGKLSLDKDIRACIILHNINFEDLITVVKKSLKMKAFL